MVEVKSWLAAVGLAVVIIACDDPYQRGYDDGYLDGIGESATEASPESTSFSDSFPVEVCGSGVTVGGEYVSPGPKGCVRIYGDGAFERY